ncbi:hypothetical protein Q1695_010455 [Nippostrongylus brasiliensis]|nr:hypothetical protein Q1695_010455 [Nippostrongylus brasiliensis]
MSLDASSRRLMKELQQLSTEPPTGIVVNKDAASADLKQWRVDVIGATGTLYEGEKFSLQFRFTQQYPFNSPEVMFVGENIPVHPHVYSNGHICLSILSEDWTPALSVQAVCLSILSMLSSAREKKRPPDNALYVRTCNKNPSKTRWWFHDDTPTLRCDGRTAADPLSTYHVIEDVLCAIYTYSCCCMLLVCGSSVLNSPFAAL